MDCDTNVLQSFALDNDGKIVHVQDVTRGADCGCRCPACAGSLIARQGDVRQWHFAHMPGVDCPGAAESALHRAAKEVIVRAGGLELPSAFAEHRIQHSGGREFVGRAEQPYGWFDFSEAVAEAPFGRVRADVWLSSPHFQLLVEVVVSHEVTAEKALLLQQLGLPALEIRLDALRSSSWTWAELEENTVHSVSNKSWIVSPDAQVLADRARVQAEAQAAQEAPPSGVVTRQRLKVSEMFVDITERDFGVCVWSSYHPEVTPQIAGVCRRLGGRWRPKYRNWVVPVQLREELLARMRELGQANDRPP